MFGLCQGHGGDGDFDPVQASRMSVLLPHHRDAKKLRARVNKLVDDAVTAFPVPSEMDEASGWVRALRLYAEQLGTKKTVKKKKADSDDEDSVDDEPIVYDDREMEVDTSLGRTRLETQAERRASEVAAPAPWDDEEEVDDRWSDRRTFKGRARWRRRPRRSRPRAGSSALLMLLRLGGGVRLRGAGVARRRGGAHPKDGAEAAPRRGRGRGRGGLAPFPSTPRRIIHERRARDHEHDGLRPRAPAAHRVEGEPDARVPPQSGVQRAHLLVRADAFHVVSAPAPLELDELRVEVQVRRDLPPTKALENVERALVEVVAIFRNMTSPAFASRNGPSVSLNKP